MFPALQLPEAATVEFLEGSDEQLVVFRAADGRDVAVARTDDYLEAMKQEESGACR